MQYLSLINSITGSSGLGAKLMFVLSIVMLIRYLNINYPQEILLIFAEDMPGLLSFDFINSEQFFASEEEALDFNGICLPNKFSNYDISYFFLNNSTNTLIYLGIIILIGILFNFLNSKANYLGNLFKWKIF